MEINLLLVNNLKLNANGITNKHNIIWFFIGLQNMILLKQIYSKWLNNNINLKFVIKYILQTKLIIIINFIKLILF